ncbi:hypothetical protein ACHAXT_000148 [Thalassiosira profunda]
MATPAASPAAPPPDDLDWEEWDAASSPLSFGHHCLAGSFAGVAEHTLLYPLDTVKTCWQSQVLGGCGGEASCGVGAVVSSVRGAGGSGGALGAPQAMAETAAAATPATPAASSGLSANQGIWSTMKHLMQQGHHRKHAHHPHPLSLNYRVPRGSGHSANHHLSHAHVYTLAGNPPNVVDLTANGAAERTRGNVVADTTKRKASGIKRPWSKQSRILRQATIDDITAQGMIRASGDGGGSVTFGADAMAAQPNNAAGFRRLWRGVQTMFVGCIPAHALYFSSYEIIKAMCTDQGHPHHNHDKDHSHQPPEGHVGHDTLSTSQAMLAGGVATLLHDFVMTPMDTMKQRMQLGHYDNLRHAFGSIVWGDNGTSLAKDTGRTAGEGWRGLYRSFPVTVMTNVPYGMIMMTTNEWLRGVLEDGMYGLHSHEGAENPFHFGTILLSGMGAGAIASAATAPLDRVKTRLQTQRMGMVVPSAGASSTAGASGAILEERAVAAAQGEPKVCPKMAVRNVRSALFPSSAAPAASTNAMSAPLLSPPPRPETPFRAHYATPLEAFRSILREEGPRGLFRGTLPRVALHAPSVAISWTAYEMAKDWLVWAQQQQ